MCATRLVQGHAAEALELAQRENLPDFRLLGIALVQHTLGNKDASDNWVTATATRPRISLPKRADGAAKSTVRSNGWSVRTRSAIPVGHDLQRPVLSPVARRSPLGAVHAENGVRLAPLSVCFRPNPVMRGRKCILLIVTRFRNQQRNRQAEAHDPRTSPRATQFER
jgi:hypothetical protein